MAYSVTLASPEQVAGLPDVELAAATLLSPTDLPPALAAEATALDTLAAAQRAGHLWVASTEAGEEVGFALVELLGADPHLAHLAELDVRPEHGRQGLGTRLVEAVLAWAGEHGYPELTLTTFDHVPWNRPYYERLGFRVIDEAELGTELREALREEARLGLRNRVAMIHELGRAA